MVIDNVKKFCISLKRTKERTEYVKKLFEKNNLDVQIFYGVDGDTLNIEDFNVYETLVPGWETNKVRNGVVGGKYSHTLLWNVIWRLGYEEAVIFEDDVEFVDGWKENFELAYKELPNDWDMFYLGTIYFDWHAGPTIRISPHLVQYKPLGLHGYMIRKKIFKPLIEACSTSFVDIDFGLSNCQRNVYISDPLLVTEKSYNNGNRTKEGIWKTLSNPDFL